jgi:nitrogen fixation protein NifZ
MSAATNPRFDWGQRVQAATDLFNDGSYPEEPVDALLVGAGAAGEIVQVGKHVDSGATVYIVEFASDRLIGCFEPELTPAESRGATP